MQNKPNLPLALFLMGPTTSGKSHTALQIAEKYPVEIVSVDSAQVYRHMDIGTAKPDLETLTKTPHHLINLINPDEQYSAAQFCTDALKVMQEITARNKIPLLTGGTMLYFRALRDGLSVLPPADKALRLKIENTAKIEGWPAMHDKLTALDPQSAARIQSTDSQRIQRALEVCYLTNKPMSEILKKPRQSALPYQIINIALQPSERSILHTRIAERFKTMVATGLIEEVQSIRKQFDVNLESPSMRCVGYRQVWQYLDNKINLTEMNFQGIAATRQLAKRQLTWLRGMKNHHLQHFDCLDKQLFNQIDHFLEDAMQ